MINCFVVKYQLKGQSKALIIFLRLQIPIFSPLSLNTPSEDPEDAKIKLLVNDLFEVDETECNHVVFLSNPTDGAGPWLCPG